MLIPLRSTELLPGTLLNLFYPPDSYTYFRHADEVSFAQAASMAKAAWAADAAMLAYARYGQRRMTGPELDENFGRAKLRYEKIGGTIGDWNAPGTQAVFASHDDFAILAFRGTEVDDPDNLTTDADLILVHEPDYLSAPRDSRPALGHLSFVSHLFSEPCMVHRGFQSALNEVWDEVRALVADYRDKHPQKEICLTGHSLGGALAVLAFSRLAGPDMSLYTFGCPRVGDGAFRDRVLSNPGKGISRYVNYNDAVAHIPTESFLYRQTPETCYRFTQDGCIEPDDGAFKGDVASLKAAFMGLPASLQSGNLATIPAPPSVVDHSPARYCFRLWDFVAISGSASAATQ